MLFYSLKSLIPNAKNNNPTNITSQTTPPLRNCQAAAPRLCQFETQAIAAMINRIRPIKSSNHLFMIITKDFSL